MWSYFHALRESDSEMAKHFVIIAPNLTVFERLREDFRPEGGGPDIFDTDPLISPEWRGDWNFSVVLQDEAGGTSTGGALHLTNVHRLHDHSTRKKADAEMHDWAGPKVAKASALDTSEVLRDRITSHKRLMVLNDEAHHVWDQDSAWNEAIRQLNAGTRKRFSTGLVAQLDFSATPKDNKGRVFRHVVCDTPLGEAVDAGIVKTPIIGRTGNLVEQVHDDAAYKYEAHLRLGYERWWRSHEEWKSSGKKALLFVMCTDTNAADQITRRLNTDSAFSELNGKTINLHTNLKGKVKRKRIGGQTIEVFEESEREIKDEDLKAIRRISRELDGNDSPYSCIVSVLMLREGWDVRNVTTIVPLRPYSAEAGILPEQTLGRGLRRMTPPGQANELVTVVEHPAFSTLYKQELEEEGLPIEAVDADKVPSTTVSIFPDPKKNWDDLDIVLPSISAANSIKPILEKLSFNEVEERFKSYTSLPLGSKKSSKLKYEGRHLITDEIIEEMTVHLPLLQNGMTAISFYIRELEAACKVQSTHSVLAPVLQRFLGEQLFGEKVSLFDMRLISRLADQDVREHIRAVFVPLIRSKTVEKESRLATGRGEMLRHWKPYQATYSERKPVEQAKHTIFNLVPCDLSLEVAMTSFLDKASDFQAFAKNAGPQALRIDYLTPEQRLAFYKPDFFVRMSDDRYALVETKGRQDTDVTHKASAALEWCKAASNGTRKWEYVFVPQSIMSGFAANRFEDLVRTCEPALQNILSQKTASPELPLFENMSSNNAETFFGKDIFDKLNQRYKRAAQDSLDLYRFFENRDGKVNFSPLFTSLIGPLDEACKHVIIALLKSSVPVGRLDQQEWFRPNLGSIDPRTSSSYESISKNLRRGLIYGNPHSVIGLLKSCLDIAENSTDKVGGIFGAIREKFKFPSSHTLLNQITKVNEFRNTFVAHANKELDRKEMAEENLKLWVGTLARLQ